MNTTGKQIQHLQLERAVPAVPLSMLWVYRLVRLGLGTLFVWSGASKIADPQAFALIIEAYGLVPDMLVFPAALGLSILELLGGVGLWFDIQGSSELIAMLLILFMLILSYGLWLGLDVDCGCFGPDDPEGNAYHGLFPALYRDAFMLAGIGLLYFCRQRRFLRPVRLRHLIHALTQGGKNR
ncbi:MAG: DoxX family membrane protein [Desulfobacteraceae bacterium]|nr:MAG: DoxX family membrane protein [Desulfobacteraceae bacterium]